jgi:hypothetical protein
MPQPNVVCPFKKAHIICVAELLFLILGSVKVTLAQSSTPPTKSALKRLVYQVQTFKGGSGLMYGLPGDTRPAISDIYEQVGPNVDAKQLVQGGEDPAHSTRSTAIGLSMRSDARRIGKCARR